MLCCLLVTSAVGLEGLLPLLTLLEGLLDDTFEDPEAADTDLAPPPSVGLSGVCCWVEDEVAEDGPEAGVDVEVAGAMVADMAS